MEEEAPETAPETISETVPVIVQEDEASAIIEAVEPESAPPLDVEVDNSPVNEPLEIETQDEATTHPEELIKILMSENEILKQENNELRNRIEQLENLHITHPATKANQSPNQQSRKKAGKTSANDAAASDSTGAKKVAPILSPPLTLPNSPSWILLLQHCARCHASLQMSFVSLNPLPNFLLTMTLRKSSVALNGPH
jgi:TolA-binding protein